MVISDFLPIPRVVFWSFGAVVIVTLASLVGYLSGAFQVVMFWLLLGVAAGLMLWRLEWAIFLIFGEIIAGGKGHLFTADIFGFSLSWRLALFAAVVGIWLIRRFTDRHWRFWQTPLRWPGAALLVVLAFGVIHGLLKHDPVVVFFDVNGYFFFALIFIAADLVRTEAAFQKLVSVVSGAVIAVLVLTLIVFSYFSFFQSSEDFIQATRLSTKQLELSGQTPETAELGQTLNTEAGDHVIRTDDLMRRHDVIYRWLRDDGIAEVSYLGGSFFRVFYYSHIWLLFGFFLYASLFIHRAYSTARGRWFWGASAIAALGTLLISFSRSLLLGLGVGLIASIFFMSRRQQKKVLAVGAVGLIAAAMITAAAFPSVFSVVAERITGVFNPSQEIASQTRTKLLPPIWERIKDHPVIGNGFGATVVIPTFVPDTDQVKYISVYLFEWTYLDIVVKIGLVGLAVFGIWLYRLGRSLREWYQLKQSLMAQWLLVCLIAFAVINISTPYLNHPLGIGLLLLIIISLNVYRYARTE